MCCACHHAHRTTCNSCSVHAVHAIVALFTHNGLAYQIMNQKGYPLVVLLLAHLMLAKSQCATCVTTLIARTIRMLQQVHTIDYILEHMYSIITTYRCVVVVFAMCAVGCSGAYTPHPLCAVLLSCGTHVMWCITTSYISQWQVAHFFGDERVQCTSSMCYNSNTCYARTMHVRAHKAIV